MKTQDDAILLSEDISIDIASTDSFDDLGLNKKITAAIQKAGFTAPSPIQKMAIPVILQKRDVIAQAQTGSGKTAAFILPAIQQLKFNGQNEVLVLVPTRELADQVVKEAERFGRSLNVRCVSVIGGKSISHQMSDLNRGAHIVVATPGRMLDHLTSGRLSCFQPHIVILDEADEILDMGFIDDIKKILSMVPKTRQTLLFSATMPKPIADLSKKELSNPEHICLMKKEQTGNHEHIEQLLYLVKDYEKENALIRLLRCENPLKSLIFCRTRRDADDLCSRLVDQGFKAQALHGDMSQMDRQRVIQNIKNGRLKILIATDIASRGIDIEDLSHVFNYSLPESAERYVHRIGRTGRAGRQGKALTIATEGEWRRNSFFKSQTSKHLKFASIPTLGAVEKILNLNFFEEINKTPLSGSAEKFCNELLKTPEEVFQFLCKLVSNTREDLKNLGPDKIGIPATEAALMASKKNRPISSSPNSRGYSRPRFGSGGGGRPFRGPATGGRGRSGGSRDAYRGRSASN